MSLHVTLFSFKLVMLLAVKDFLLIGVITKDIVLTSSVGYLSISMSPNFLYQVSNEKLIVQVSV